MDDWYRVTNLPETTLTKRALPENIKIHTNWTKTIEKVIGIFNLADKIENPKIFNSSIKKALEEGFTKYWTNSLKDPTQSRLLFYRKTKTKFECEKYLNLLTFYERRALTKLKCCDHTLEIEKGRHRKVIREERTCPFCPTPVVEDEDHFLFHCPQYEHLRNKYEISATIPLQTIFNDNTDKLAKFTNEAFEHRKNKLENKTRGGGWAKNGKGEIL